MESDQFDRAARLWASGSSRRSLMGLLAGGALGFSASDGEARKKKRRGKKKKRQHGQGPSSPPGTPPASPPSGGCPAGARACNGACIPSNACCDTIECTVAAQVCASSGRCECPPSQPEICGDVCLRPCASNESRKPDCECCTANGGLILDPATCCSGNAQQNGACIGRPAGAACSFGAQCASLNCVLGFCSPCAVGADFCTAGSTCGIGGRCLQAVDGTTRCGIPFINDVCGLCTRDLDCDQGQGLGYFCARSTGPNCTCPTGQTFCARP